MMNLHHTLHLAVDPVNKHVQGPPNQQMLTILGV
jgi:hypothetical protein